MFLASDNMEIGNLIGDMREAEGKYRGEDSMEPIYEICTQLQRVCIKDVDNDEISKRFNIPQVLINFLNPIEWDDGIEDTSDSFVQQLKTFLEGIHSIDISGSMRENGSYLFIAINGPKIFNTDQLMIGLPIISEDIRLDVFYFTFILHYRFDEEDNPEVYRTADIRICVIGDCRMVIEYDQYYFVYKIELKYQVRKEFKNLLEALNSKYKLKMEEEESEFDEDIKYEYEVEVKEEPEYEELQHSKFQMIIDVKMEEEESELDEEAYPEPDPFEQDKPHTRKIKKVPVQIKEEEEDESVEREIKMEDMNLPIKEEVEMEKNSFVRPKSWKELYDNLKNALFEFEYDIEHKKRYNFTIEFKGESLERRHKSGLRYITINIRYDGMLVNVEGLNYNKIYPLNDLIVKRFEICTDRERPGFTIYSEIYRGRLYVFMYLEGDKFRISF